MRNLIRAALVFLMLPAMAGAQTVRIAGSTDAKLDSVHLLLLKSMPKKEAEVQSNLIAIASPKPNKAKGEYLYVADVPIDAARKMRILCLQIPKQDLEKGIRFNNGGKLTNMLCTKMRYDAKVYDKGGMQGIAGKLVKISKK